MLPVTTCPSAQNIQIGVNRPWAERVWDGIKNRQFGLYQFRIDKVAWYGSSTSLLRDGQVDRHLTQEMMDFGRTMAEKNIIMKFGAGVYPDRGPSIMGAAPYGAALAGGRVEGYTTRQIANWEPPLDHPNIRNKIKRGYKLSHALFRRINALMRGTDAFVVAPGGLGTDYEGTRVLNDQYMLHLREKRPVIFLNIPTQANQQGFWQGLKIQYTAMLSEGFSSPLKIGRDGNPITNIRFVDRIDQAWGAIFEAYADGINRGMIRLPRWQELANWALKSINCILR